MYLDLEFSTSDLETSSSGYHYPKRTHDLEGYFESPALQSFQNKPIKPQPGRVGLVPSPGTLTVQVVKTER